MPIPTEDESDFNEHELWLPGFNQDFKPESDFLGLDQDLEPESDFLDLGQDFEPELGFSEFNKKQKKLKIITFTPLKVGKTENGIEYSFCKTLGMGIRQGVWIEKRMLEKLKIDINSKSYKISTTKFLVVKTNKGDFYKFYLRVPPAMWFKIKGLKERLQKGIKWDILKEEVQLANLELQEIKSERYGLFILIKPSELHFSDQRHKLKIYPGNSIKNSGLGNLSLLDYIDKNKDRITFKSFSKGDKIYYRFYLQKFITINKKV